MQAVANGDGAALNEAQEGFVDERAGLQRVIDALVRHVLDGDAVQFPVHERNQALEGGVVAVTPLNQQGGDIGVVFDASIVALLTTRPLARA